MRGEGMSVGDPVEVGDVMDALLASHGPALLEVVVDP